MSPIWEKAARNSAFSKERGIAVAKLHEICRSLKKLDPAYESTGVEA